MSGIIAALRTDNGPVDRRVLECLMAPLAVRGPDAQEMWCDGNAALGHRRLQIGARVDVQPLTLGGEAWIVADARIDDRRTTADALGIPPAATRSDAELILRAYAKWGDACVNYLIGDFAFAIWDRRARRLFCARDHLGVRPLYYTDTGGWLLVSSSLASLRCHPAVSDALNDGAVADFLLFGHNADPSTTSFRDIRRLPPAHSLSWSSGDGCRLRRYWQLPIEEPTYRSDGDCAAELRDLLDSAIVDRSRGERVGVMFSGGLDSVTVAARAGRCGAAHGEDAVRAFTFTHASIFPDREREHATAAAAHLRIPCHFYEADTSDGWASFEARRTPEPLCPPLDSGVQVRCLRDMAAHSRIALSGEGPDNVLIYEWFHYLRYLWRRREFRRIACDAGAFLLHHRRLPLWSSLTRHRPRSKADDRPPIPSWVSADLVKRLQLEERWRVVMRPADSHHPIRPAAWFSLQIPLWQTVHNEWDPCYTGVPLELSHPFLDVRVLRLLLNVPVIPWCRDKHLLRYAFRDDLPPAVRLRPKTPLPDALDVSTFRRCGVPPVAPSDRLDVYVSPDANFDMGVGDAESAAAALRLATLSHWLAHLDARNVAVAVG